MHGILSYERLIFAIVEMDRKRLSKKPGQSVVHTRLPIETAFQRLQDAHNSRSHAKSGGSPTTAARTVATETDWSAADTAKSPPSDDNRPGTPAAPRPFADNAGRGATLSKIVVD